MAPRPEPPGGSDTTGTVPLHFDPATYPVAVTGVAIAYNSMSEVATANNPHPDTPAAAFGPIAQAWTAFHTAWSSEVQSAAQALSAMVQLLPSVGVALDTSDGDGGGAVSSLAGDGPGVGQGGRAPYTSPPGGTRQTRLAG
ncbi:MAG: hypothetical protein JWN03_6473 [Nocardia sp.]|uniref:hypothetical protein n=1 Tax=Nocardia sp. TaxID=1821 RepID=UPI0026056824|nr:hypothetical protein [Nocardia sp.]MCU1646198.1 hypothetical protein [Nocardia sp.]